VKLALIHVYMVRGGNAVFAESIKCICSHVVLFQCIVLLLSDHIFIAGASPTTWRSAMTRNTRKKQPAGMQIVPRALLQVIFLSMCLV
jgi:hypothetical protein